MTDQWWVLQESDGTLHQVCLPAGQMPGAEDCEGRAFTAHKVSKAGCPQTERFEGGKWRKCQVTRSRSQARFAQQHGCPHQLQFDRLNTLFIARGLPPITAEERAALFPTTVTKDVQ